MDLLIVFIARKPEILIKFVQNYIVASSDFVCNY